MSLILTTTREGSDLSIVIVEMRKLRPGKDGTCAKGHTDGKARIQAQGRAHPAPKLCTAASRARIVISCATQVKCLLLIVKYLFHYLVEEYRFPIFISDVNFSFRIKLI